MLILPVLRQKVKGIGGRGQLTVDLGSIEEEAREGKRAPTKGS